MTVLFFEKARKIVLDCLNECLGIDDDIVDERTDAEIEAAFGIGPDYVFDFGEPDADWGAEEEEQDAVLSIYAQLKELVKEFHLPESQIDFILKAILLDILNTEEHIARIKRDFSFLDSLFHNLKIDKSH